MSYTPLIVAIGGTCNPGSSTERALMIALDAAEKAGASTLLFDGEFLMHLPHYSGKESDQSETVHELVDAVRRCDGILVASPGYHGSISGLVKNAIDHLEATAKDRRIYLDGIPVGLIATAYGGQAAASTLATLRSIAHALRGWPTPLGVAVNSSGGLFNHEGCTDAAVTRQLELVGRQVADAGRVSAAHAGRI